MNTGNSESYRRAEADTTEWEDIHSKHKTEGYEYVKDIKTRQRKQRNEDWVNVHHDDSRAVKDLDEEEEELAAKAAAAEDSDDSFDDDDDDILRRMREKRMAQLKEKKQKERYGTVQYIHRSEYVKEVTEASKTCPVVLHLYQDYIPDCEIMARALNEVALRKRAVKMLKIKATDCIENFPDRSCPCLIIYNGGKMTHKFEGLNRFGGKKMTPDDLEWHLAQANVCETNMEENPRIDHIIADVMEAKAQESLE